MLSLLRLYLMGQHIHCVPLLLSRYLLRNVLHVHLIDEHPCLVIFNKVVQRVGIHSFDSGLSLVALPQ